MKRLMFPAVVAALGILGLCVPAGAQPVQTCYSLSPFCDVMQLDRTGTSLHGLWWACSPRPGSLYNLSVSGTRVRLVPPSGPFHIGLNATHDSTSFGGAHNCTLDVPSFAAGSGNGNIECVGPGVSFGPVAVTLTTIPCPAPADAARPGNPVGQ